MAPRSSGCHQVLWRPHSQRTWLRLAIANREAGLPHSTGRTDDPVVHRRVLAVAPAHFGSPGYPYFGRTLAGPGAGMAGDS